MITASQSIKLFEILNMNFKNEEDAKQVVREIEAVIENRFFY